MSAAAPAPTPDPDPDPDPDPEPEDEGMWRNCINVTDAAYGATGDGVTNDYAAVVLALAAAKLAALPLYFPTGRYRIEFSKGRDEVGGRLLIDFPNFECFGDGPGKTILNVRSPSLPVSRRLSMIDSTVSRGVVATVLGNGTGVTLTLLADADRFTVGDIVFFSPNSDGSSPRALEMTSAGGINEVTGTPGTTLTITGMDLLNGAVQPGDHIFIKNKMYLQTAGDHALFSALCGIRVSSSATATADGDFRAVTNSPRETIKVRSIDTAANALNILLDFDTVTGFADGDYIYIIPNSALFVFDVSEEAATSNYDLSVHDMTITGDFWGYDQRFTTGATNISNRLFSYEPSFASAVEMLEANISFKRLRVEGFLSQFYMQDGTNYSNPHVRWEFEKCDLSDSAACWSMFYDDAVELPDIWFTVRDCYIHDIDGSHAGYIHSNISIQIHENRFENILAGECIDHFGSNCPALLASVTNNWFGGTMYSRVFLTATKGSWLFAGNVVESGSLGFRGGQGLVVGNTWRPSVGEYTCIEPYFGCFDNQSLIVEGNFFDFGRIPSASANGGVCLEIQYDGNYTFRDNDITAMVQSGGNNAPLVASSFHYGVVLSANGSDVTDLLVVDIDNNRMRFDPSAGQHYLALIGYYGQVAVRNNRYVGRGTSTGGAIRLNGTTGSGRVVLDNNKLDVTNGPGITTNSTWSGTPTVAITRNRIATATALRNPIDMSHTASADIEISDNFLNGQSLAILSGAGVAAGSVWGSGNRFNGDTVDFSTAQRLLPRRSLLTTTVTAATSTSLSADFDTFRLVDSGAVTIDTLLLGGAAAAQLAFDGASITLIFTTGNITLGAGGNITAAGGARTIGTACRLIYSTAAAKWIEI